MYEIEDHKLQELGCFEIPRPEDLDWRSNETEGYNCFAFAAGFNQFSWDPLAVRFPSGGRVRWPTNSDSNDISNLITAFETERFLRCEEHEPYDVLTTERVALFCHSNGEMTHAIWERENGRWASKLGDYEDIDQRDVRSFEGLLYGRLAVFMQRSRIRFERDFPAPLSPIM